MKKVILMAIIASIGFSCKTEKPAAEADNFEYNVEQFADLGVLRYRVTDWDSLSLQQKQLVYCLNEAALFGRDILFDQNNRYNLAIRRTLEAIYANYAGDKTTDNYRAFVIYLKRIWFSDGIHHHYGAEKFAPAFSQSFFEEAVRALDAKLVPTRDGQTIDAFLAEITPVIFDTKRYAKKTNQDSNLDVIVASANNYYGEGVTQREVEAFYNAQRNPADNTPVAYGLNSRLVKKNGRLVEEVYKVGGLYSAAIERIVYWLKEARQFAENEQQGTVIDLLVRYYETGDLKIYDD